MTETAWAVRLFEKSVLKQSKFREISTLLGPTERLDCLDLGSDNGVISYLLRQRGGNWASADLDVNAVRSIEELVKTNVHRLDGQTLPFADASFDRVVIVDMLEHVADDRRFASEIFRVLRPGGVVIVNVPHLKNGLVRKFRTWIGQTDEKHGHLRPGYTDQSLAEVMGSCFTVEQQRTYSRFFSEFIDAAIVGAVTLLKGSKAHSSKGLVVTGSDMKHYQSMFRLYSLIYPVVWSFSKLDGLLFFDSGHMLIVKAQVNK
jgi:2-polyprenyl-3-methyl-5-hydroxy-6-metoxy-1,4-benzoquinol methylase